MNEQFDSPPQRNGGLFLAWSISVTALGFLAACISCFTVLAIPPGIVGIVFSTKINGEIDRGNAEGARKAIASAKLWNWIATGVLIAMILLGIALFAVLGASLGDYQQYLENYGK